MPFGVFCEIVCTFYVATFINDSFIIKLLLKAVCVLLWLYLILPAVASVNI